MLIFRTMKHIFTSMALLIGKIAVFGLRRTPCDQRKTNASFHRMEWLERRWKKKRCVSTCIHRFCFQRGDQTRCTRYLPLFTVPFRAIGRAGKYNVDDDLAKIQDFDEGCKFRTSLIKLAPFIPRSIFARYREI